jgi:hypothetical protein
MAAPHTTIESFPVPPPADTIEAVRLLQMGQHNTDLRLWHVEEASKQFGEIQKKMDDKLDSIHKLIYQWNGSEMGSAQRPQRPTSSSPSPIPDPPPQLTTEGMAFLKKQEVAGKISLHPDSFIHTGKFTHEAFGSSTTNLLPIPQTPYRNMDLCTPKTHQFTKPFLSLNQNKHHLHNP